MTIKNYTIVQLCPNLNSGGIERGLVDLAISLQKNGFNSIVFSNGGRLVSSLTLNGVQHIKLPIHSKNPLLFLINLFRLKRKLKAINPHLILPYSRIPTWLIYFLSKSIKVPFISHCNGCHTFGFLGLKKFYNNVLTKGQNVIANSYFTKQYLLNNYNIQEDKINVVLRGIDTDIFNDHLISINEIIASKKSWALPEDKIIILLAARFSRKKGQHILLSALHHIKNLGKANYHVVLVGDDSNASYAKQIHTLIQSLNLEDDVSIVGDCKDMRMAYALADIVVSSSIEPEAFGRTIVEAQAMNKIVIATDHGGARESIQDGISGFLVPPNNPESLANAIIAVENMSLSQKIEMIQIANDHVKKFFTKDIMCQKLIGLIINHLNLQIPIIKAPAPLISPTKYIN